MAHIVTYTFIVIGLMTCTFSLLQFVSRKKGAVNYWLGLLFLCFGCIWLYFGIYRATRFAWAQWLLYGDVLVTFMLGPALYCYTLSLAGALRGRSRAMGILSFVPAAAVLAYLVAAGPAFSLPLSALSGPNPDYYAIPAVNVINTIGDAYFLCFAVVSTAIVIRLHRGSDGEFRKAFRGVLSYYLIGLSTFALFFAGHLMSSDNLLALATLINGVNGTYYFFYSYRYPEYSQRTVRPQRTVRSRSPAALDGIDAKRVLGRLREVMESAEGYRDPNLTLQSLSARLGIQYFQLSRILNESLGTSFHSYVNERRLEEARRLLTEEPDMSILEIAFAVGFNSKSAFHSAFMKNSKVSPRDFRREKLPS